MLSDPIYVWTFNQTRPVHTHTRFRHIYTSTFTSRSSITKSGVGHSRSLILFYTRARLSRERGRRSEGAHLFIRLATWARGGVQRAEGEVFQRGRDSRGQRGRRCVSPGRRHGNRSGQSVASGCYFSWGQRAHSWRTHSLSGSGTNSLPLRVYPLLLLEDTDAETVVFAPNET